MDAQAGSLQLRFSQRIILGLIAVLTLLMGMGAPTLSWAALDQSAMHFTGDKTLWYRREGYVELIGNAVYSQVGQTLNAKYIRLDFERRTLYAKGDCIFISAETVIKSEELEFHLDTHVGTITKGSVTNGQFLLSGNRISKLSDQRFLAFDAQYTTCIDCPGTWSLMGEDIDLTVDGYAFMDDVTAKFKDAPIAWSPYMVIPVKTRRQTGFLFPKFTIASDDGFKTILPFFWAISRSTDMTISPGILTLRGLRGEWEGRYVLTEKSYGTANFYYQRDIRSGIRDLRTDSEYKDRWAVNINQTQVLPWGFTQKLKFTEVGDILYPRDFGDVEGRELATLNSEFSISTSRPNISGYVAARRFRNLLDLLKTSNVVTFDPNTVQLYPRLFVSSNDRFVPGLPVALGVDFDLSNFYRNATFYDNDPDVTSQLLNGGDPDAFNPGYDPVREATRISYSPNLYMPLRPFDRFSLVPSIRYLGYYYNFHNAIPNLNRGYVLFQTDFTFQIEKVYETGSEKFPKMKHLIRPLLRYSRIPHVSERRDHEFIKQIRRRSGYNFDNKDIVPEGRSNSFVNYFTPLGHSLTYGFTTQLIQRGKPDPKSRVASYQRTLELKGDQALDFLEFKKPDDKQVPLSRANVSLLAGVKDFAWNTQYYYYPYLLRYETNFATNPSPHDVTTSLTYYADRAYHEKIFEYERSIGLGYNFSKLQGTSQNLGMNITFSFNDYFLVRGSTQYNMVRRDSLSTMFPNNKLEFQFQSPSRCWKFNTLITRSLDQETNISFDFTLNLTGAGFTGLSAGSQQNQSGT